LAAYYAHPLVEIPIEGPFPNYIQLFNEDAILIRQPVTYEWLPTKCAHCEMMGHTEDVSKKKGIIRAKWRKVQKPPSPPIPEPSPHPDAEPALAPPEPHAYVPPVEATTSSFTPVTRGTSPKRSSDLATTLMHSIMSHIASWNVRGSNWPNKQEDVKRFLHLCQVGLVGLLETKIKSQKVDNIAANIFP